jgi:hypothetical protein
MSHWFLQLYITFKIFMLYGPRCKWFKCKYKKVIGIIIRVVTHPDFRVRMTSGRVRRPHGRHASATPPGGRLWQMAWRTAIRPLVARFDWQLEGERPLRPLVEVRTSRQMSFRRDFPERCPMWQSWYKWRCYSSFVNCINY